VIEALPSSNRTTTAIGKRVGAGLADGVGAGVGVRSGVADGDGVWLNPDGALLDVGMGVPHATRDAISVESSKTRRA
jgi:hypothetical protein